MCLNQWLCTRPVCSWYSLTAGDVFESMAVYNPVCSWYSLTAGDVFESVTMYKASVFVVFSNSW